MYSALQNKSCTDSARTPFRNLRSALKAAPGAAAISLFALSAPAFAQDDTDEKKKLLDIVREQKELVARQAAELAAMKARLDAIEAREAEQVAAANQPAPHPLVATDRVQPTNEAPPGTQVVPPKTVLVPFAPQIIPPGPADASIAMARAVAAASLDNVLAVAGAAHEHPGILIVGLMLSVALTGLAANLLARVIERYRWVAYVGLIVILYVAVRMILDGWSDPITGLGKLFS